MMLPAAVAVTAIVALTTTAAVAVFMDRETNPQTLSVDPSWPPVPPRSTVRAQLMSRSGGATSIDFTLQLINDGAEPVALESVAVRFWFTNDGGFEPSTSACYYTPLPGNCSGSVIHSVAEVAPTRTGGDRHLAVGFRSTAGPLASGASTGQIQLTVSRNDGVPFDRTNDYSRATTADFTDASSVTVYVGGVLVWGTEPSVAPITRALSVEYADLSPATPTQGVAPGLRVRNNGSYPEDALAKVTMRYWFTKDAGSSAFQAYCELAYYLGGCGAVTARAVAANPPRTGADYYLEVGFNAGRLPSGSSTGEIRLKIVKSDYSAFDQTNDYSYDTNTTYAAAPRVTLYVDGELVWGTPPP